MNEHLASLNAIYAEEKTYQGRAEAYLEDGKYFPGFFVFLARKKDSRAPPVMEETGTGKAEFAPY